MANDESVALAAEVLDDLAAVALALSPAPVEFLFVPSFYCPFCGGRTRYPFPLLMAYLPPRRTAPCSVCGRLILPVPVPSQ